MSKIKGMGKNKNDKSRLPVSEVNNSIDEKITFSFKCVKENFYPLHDWNKNELKDLVRCLKKIEGFSKIDDLIKHKGLNLKPVPIKDTSIIESFERGSVFHEVKVCEKKRLFVHISRNVFYLLGFDRNHKEFDRSANAG